MTRRDSTAPFDSRSRLELSDTELAELVRYSGHLCYRHAVLPDEIDIHCHGVVARIEARWRDTHARIFREGVHPGLPPTLHMIVECAYRRGPANASELAKVICWAHGPWWVGETSSLRDISLLRDLLRKWPGSEGESLPTSVQPKTTSN